MTRRTVLPSHDDVQLAIKQITETTGTPPTVPALARHLGLANTIFGRRFPDITTDLTQQRSPGPTGPGHDGASRFEKIQRENAELRRAKHELTEQPLPEAASGLASADAHPPDADLLGPQPVRAPTIDVRVGASALADASR